jgi:hypothetical protein
MDTVEQKLEQEIIEKCYKSGNRQNIPDSIIWARQTLNKDTEQEQKIEYLWF